MSERELRDDEHFPGEIASVGDYREAKRRGVSVNRILGERLFTELPAALAEAWERSPWPIGKVTAFPVVVAWFLVLMLSCGIPLLLFGMLQDARVWDRWFWKSKP